MTDFSEIYIIECHRAQKRILVRFFSHLTPEAHKQFMNDVVNIFQRETHDGDKFDLMFDLLQSSVQPPDIAEDNSWVFAIAPYLRRSAIILTSPTYKLQLNRMARKTLPEGQRLYFFDTIEAAQQWLDERDNS